MTSHTASYMPKGDLVARREPLEEAIDEWAPRCACGFGSNLRCGSRESARSFLETHLAMVAS